MSTNTETLVAKPRHRALPLFAAICAAFVAAASAIPVASPALAQAAQTQTAQTQTAQTQAAQTMTDQQMIEKLLGKTSRGVTQGASKGSVQQAPAKSLNPSETSRLRSLLDKAGTRAFSAKERTEVAEAVKDRPSLDFEIYFPFNSSTVQKTAEPTLQKIGQILSNEAFQDRGFLIAGHTDAKGTPEANQIVSQRRAESVRAYLVKHFNIDPARLRVIGYGKEQLKDDAQPFASVNRRVQIINLPDGAIASR